MSAQDSRWADALLRSAVVSKQEERTLQELKAVRDIFAEHKRYFNNPLLPVAEQEALFRDLEADGISGLTVQFLCLLAAKRKMRSLPAIVRRYEDLARKVLGRAEVVLRVPFAPSPGMLERIRDYIVGRGLLTEQQKDKAKIDVVIDKSLLGGFVAECGGLVLDESLQSRLNALSAYGW